MSDILRKTGEKPDRRLPQFNEFPSPCYVVDEGLLTDNLKILQSVSDTTGCKILLALKGFSMYSLFPLIGEYLSGITASSLNEARLGFEEMGKEVHSYAPAFSPKEFDGILTYSDTIVFNSPNQWKKYREKVKLYEDKTGRTIKCGIRVNPEYSEIEVPIYNPCAPFSRLGASVKVLDESFKGEIPRGITGLHFHTLCEQNSDALINTVPHVDEKFGKYLQNLQWLNMGGGHHITRKDYDIQGLIDSILYFKNKYDLEIYIEPGEAVVLNTGFLVTTVLDIVDNGMEIAIIDSSAACHMPDVIEMPYRPEIIGGGKPGEFQYTYRIGGMTCLAGDIIGDYSFPHPLKAGDRIVFTDMAHYTMVKNNTFNGINLPSIGTWSKEGNPVIVKNFGYEDYKSRL